MITLKRIYIAGPMRGYPNENFAAFDYAQIVLEADGWEVISPAQMDRNNGYDPSLPQSEANRAWDFSEAIARDMNVIRVCDAIALLPGWQDSRGVSVELSLAIALELETFEFDPEGEQLFWLDVSQPYFDEGQRSFNPYHHTVHEAQYDEPDEYPYDQEIPFEWPEDTGEQEDIGLARTGFVAYNGPDRALQRLIDEEAELKWWDQQDPGTPPLPGEVRVVDPKTGGEKGSKPCQLGFIDPAALEQLGLVAGMGAVKYASFNYLKGYAWSLSYNALQRHYLAFLGGEVLDPESGLPHMAHAAWHALALVSFETRGIGTDDRPPAYLPLHRRTEISSPDWQGGVW